MRLSDTLTGQKTEFRPGGDVVKMYVCGITPYADAHLGHAMSYVIFDVLRRYLEYRGYRVHHVQNFTDIDDRIIERANALGEPPGTLAQRFIEDYLADMRDLNVTPAHDYPRATAEIPEIVRIIVELISKGFAYVTASGDVYFRVRRKPDYGKLSHRNIDELRAGARVEPGLEKEDPADFALWKAAKPGEPSWESPWGPGRPGWHIECTAMSLRYLGEELDIHGGGNDLIFPHHENEIAQSEAYTGHQPFARYWLHNGWLQLGGEKMSKSLGNIVSIREGIERFGADTLRAFFLGSHYRSPITYSEDIIRAAGRGVDRLRAAVAAEDEGAGAPVEAGPYRERFLAAMDDDLNTPAALGALHELAHEINRGRTEGRSTAAARAVLRELAGILGLTLQPRRSDEAPSARLVLDAFVEARAEVDAAKRFDLADDIREELAALGVTSEDPPDDLLLEAILRVRAKRRAAKEFDVADYIREELAARGVTIEDTPEGTRWHFEGPSS